MFRRHEKICQELAVSKSEVARLTKFTHLGRLSGIEDMMKASGVSEGNFGKILADILAAFPGDGKGEFKSTGEAWGASLERLRSELAEKDRELAAARDAVSTGGRACLFFVARSSGSLLISWLRSDKGLLFSLRTELASVRSALAESSTKLNKHTELVSRLDLTPTDVDQILASSSAPRGLAAKERAAELRRREDVKGTLSPPSSPELQLKSLKSLKENGAMTESDANSESGGGAFLRSGFRVLGKRY